MDALTRGLNVALPELKLSDWERPLEEFVRKVGAQNDDETDRVVVPTVVAVPTATQDFPLPDKPSIAVLPFVNMSGDPDQEFFGDGIAEDILTALSKLRWMFVISRNSSFTYKGKAVDIRQVSRELGVRYVLEGSVRRAGTRARITAQLIDAVSGAHGWAERFERDLADIFAVQDEIVEAVIAAIAPAIIDAEQSRAVRKPPESLDAWETYQRGLWHFGKSGADQADIAQACFQRSVLLDPHFAPAFWAMALVQVARAADYVNSDYDQSIARAEEMVRKSLDLDPDYSNARSALGTIQYLKGHHHEAIQQVDRVLSLDPNCAPAFALKGVCLVFLGRHVDGRQFIETGLRLDPRSPRASTNRMFLAASYYLEGSYETAATIAKQLSRDYPSYPPHYRWLAAALGQLGRTAEAGAALKHLLSIAPGSVDTFIKSHPPYMPQEHHEHMLDDLRKAGWRE